MFARTPAHEIDSIFTDRWSPRAMSGESIDNAELLTLFEAARWAPSSYNGQPWRFVYAHRDTKNWNKLFELLAPMNQAWAKNAAVLVVVLSRKHFEFNDQPARTHTFDTGSAWMSLALQATMNGLVVHGMEGFDYEGMRVAIDAPESFEIEAMCAIGRPGNKADLPEQMQNMEQPSDRKPVDEIAFEGGFTK